MDKPKLRLAIRELEREYLKSCGESVGSLAGLRRFVLDQVDRETSYRRPHPQPSHSSVDFAELTAADMEPEVEPA